MTDIRLDGRTVLIADGSHRATRPRAEYFALLGARVVVNISPSQPNLIWKDDARRSATNINFVSHELEGGEDFMKEIVTQYSQVHILIIDVGTGNLAGRNMTGDSWVQMQPVNLKGVFNILKAVWPIFKNQNYGRIVFMRSSSGNESASSSAYEFALIGLAQTLSIEGSKYNIQCSFVASQDAPSLASVNVLNATAALVAHTANQDERPAIFQREGDEIVTRKFERTKGDVMNPDIGLTPTAILRQWPKIQDFSTSSNPKGPADFTKLLPQLQALVPMTTDSNSVSFRDKVVIVTGAASGLGRCYALAFAQTGATVVVNDVNDPAPVVNEIVKAGGRAIPCRASAKDGDKIVQTAIATYGRIDVVINNAGCLRDKSFQKMDQKAWDLVLDVNLNATIAVSKAAWPLMVKQGYGRIINTTSTSGIYGNFGQANYSAAKLGVWGFTDALGREGKRYGIHVNAIAPVASTSLFLASLKSTDKNAQPTFKPEYVAPIVMLLASDMLPRDTCSGGLYEVGCGWHARTRLQRYPSTKLSQQLQFSGTLPVNYFFSDKEVILYNLSIGATRNDLPLLYENAQAFQPLPTFGVIPMFTSSLVHQNSFFTPRFDPARALLGEHYLEVLKFPIPTSGTLVSTRKTVEVVDKGTSAISIAGYVTCDNASGESLFYNEATMFMPGAGGSGGFRSSELSHNRPSSCVYTIPPLSSGGTARAPDSTQKFKTSEQQAAFYRLNGDRMPIHIDPHASKQGGFPLPILHGQCSMGIVGMQVFREYGPFKAIKCRFLGVLVPGQTVRTEMWEGKDDGRENDLILFRAKTVETDRLCVSGWTRLVKDEKEKTSAKL